MRSTTRRVALTTAGRAALGADASTSVSAYPEAKRTLRDGTAR
jgi:hypothetical protein